MIQTGTVPPTLTQDGCCRAPVPDAALCLMRARAGLRRREHAVLLVAGVHRVPVPVLLPVWDCRDAGERGAAAAAAVRPRVNIQIRAHTRDSRVRVRVCPWSKIRGYPHPRVKLPSLARIGGRQDHGDQSSNRRIIAIHGRTSWKPKPKRKRRLSPFSRRRRRANGGTIWSDPRRIYLAPRVTVTRARERLGGLTEPHASVSLAPHVAALTGCTGARVVVVDSPVGARDTLYASARARVKRRPPPASSMMQQLLPGCSTRFGRFHSKGMIAARCNLHPPVMDGRCELGPPGAEWRGRGGGMMEPSYLPVGTYVRATSIRLMEFLQTKDAYTAADEDLSAQKKKKAADEDRWRCRAGHQHSSQPRHDLIGRTVNGGGRGADGYSLPRPVYEFEERAGLGRRRGSDGMRPRSSKSGTTGRPPSSPRSSDPSRPSTGRSSASLASDKPIPSFLRPTVSSSLHSSSSSSSLASPSSSSSSSFKGAAAAATARRSADKAPAAQPLSAPRPITPKEKTKAPPPSALSSSTSSRWSSVSPRHLMQKASNALKATSKSRSKKGKEAPASSSASASGKGGATGASSRAKGETTARAQPETPAEPSPAVTPVDTEEPVLLEPGASQHVATSQEVVSTDIETVEVRDHQEEHGGAERPEVEAEEEDVDVEKIILEEPGSAKMSVPEPQQLPEEKPQSSAVAETETETETLKNAEDDSPADVVEETTVNESATPERQEPGTSAVEEKVVEETKAKERQQGDALKPEEISETSVISEERPNEEGNVISEERLAEGSNVISEERPKEETSCVISEEPKEETSVISEEQKEADPVHEEVADEAKMAAESSASAPATPLKETAVHDDEAMLKQVSASEPVTPVAETMSKGKAVIETQQSVSAPVTPVTSADKKKGPSKLQATIPEESAMAFTGSKVKTAMEKRSEEEQPKKKEVARSNDVIEEAKSKLLEKRKSKVKALVGAFETVMDSPRAS
nr:unnamed protein product [Digitaria exilis]